MEEIWKDVKEYEGYYQISNFGNVKSLYCNKVLKICDSNGYSVISLSKNKIRKTKLIHVLVAKHFIPNPDNLPEVNHIDNVRSNNYITNLEWITRSGNMLHCYNTGRRKVKITTICHSDIINQYINSEDSIITVSKKFNISNTLVIKVLKTHIKTYPNDEITKQINIKRKNTRLCTKFSLRCN